MGGDGFATVHLTTDPAEGEMLVDVLHGEAIAARLLRVNSALLGAAPHIFQIKVQVPAEFEARARELIADLEHVGTLEAFSDARGPGIGEPEADPAAPTPRRPLLGAGIGLLLPGGSHFYARRPLTAIVLEAGILLCLFGLTFRERTGFPADTLAASGFAILGCDVVGGLLALRALARGQAATTTEAQIFRGLVLLAIAVAVGVAVAAVVRVPSMLRQRELTKVVVECGTRSIAVTNGSGRARLVIVDRIAVTMPRMSEVTGYATEVEGSTHLSLAPGQRDSVAFAPSEEVVSRCVTDENLPEDDCRVTFAFTVMDEDPDVVAYRASGLCAPGWAPFAPMAPATLRDVDD